MGRSLWLCAAAVLVVFACAAWEARAAVISIDFGGEWIKAALVKVSGWRAVPCWISVFTINPYPFPSRGTCSVSQPGVPMEIVLNK